MKYVAMTVLAVVGLGATLGGCAAGGTSDETVAAARLDDSPVEGRQAILTVHGMSCPLCANNVDKALMEVPGVTGVNVDMNTGNATVALDGKTPVTRRQLAEAVDKSGFSLRRVDVP